MLVSLEGNRLAPRLASKADLDTRTPLRRRGQTVRIDPGATLDKAEEKALAKDLASLVKSKAVKKTDAAPAAKPLSAPFRPAA